MRRLRIRLDEDEWAALEELLRREGPPSPEVLATAARQRRAEPLPQLVWRESEPRKRT